MTRLTRDERIEMTERIIKASGILEPAAGPGFIDGIFLGSIAVLLLEAACIGIALLLEASP